VVRFSPLVDRIAGEENGAWRVHAEGVRRREAGHDVIFLTVGDPDQAAPEAVIGATIEALRRNRTGYSPIIGYPQVRAAVAARTQQRTGRPCSADNVVLTPGTQGGLFCALNCLAGPGDEVILPEPIYGPYAGVIGASGARMVNVPLRAEKGFHPDLDSLANAITPRSRVIWINSPHNPTGAVFTADEVAGIAELCRQHDLWLLSDEVYEDLAFARPHVKPVVIARHGGAHDCRLQSVEIACYGRVPLWLGHRTAGIVTAPLRFPLVHVFRRPRLHPGRRVGGTGQ
jgi:arginine:pyruvate transaminase